MIPEKFIIFGPDDSEEKLYWSNEDGWVDKESATIFNIQELTEILLPLETIGIEFIWKR